MEGQGTGGYNLEPRVEQLESSVKGLHESQREIHRDNREMKAALAGIGVRQQGQDSVLQDIASKLDQQRTRRPELSGIAATATVLLVIWGLSLAPIYWRIDRMFNELDELKDNTRHANALASQYEAEREHINDQFSELNAWRRETSSNRFTREDGYRLEDRINHLTSDVCQ